MKEAEGGAITLDPRRLPMVVLELQRRGLQMKEVERGTIDQDPVWDSAVEELEMDVRDFAADFTHHRGAGDFTRRRGAHPDPTAKPRSARSHRRSPKPSTEDGIQ
jgi:hypothetical protein